MQGWVASSVSSASSNDVKQRNSNVPIKNHAKTAFLGVGPDFLRHPYKRQFRSLSQIKTSDNQKNQNFQYRIDPKNCVLCQKGQKLDIDVSKDYNIFVAYGLETFTDHACPQLSNVRSLIGIIGIMVISEEWPAGMIRYYTLSAFQHQKWREHNKSNAVNSIRPIEEFGHFMDHAAQIFTDLKLYEYLRCTPSYVENLDELKLAFDIHATWPYDTDPMVPQSLRSWYREFHQRTRVEIEKCAMEPPASLSFPSASTSSASASPSASASASIGEEKSSSVISSTSAIPPSTAPLPTPPTKKKVAIIASLNPYEEPWITTNFTMASLKSPNGKCTLPDPALTNWVFDPSVHTPDNIDQQFVQMRKDAFERQKASVMNKGPSWMSKLAFDADLDL